MISARTDTSSADTGSSSSSTLGSTASARAMPTRCRCPPDSSCGNRSASCGAEPDQLQQLRDPALARPGRRRRAGAPRAPRSTDRPTADAGSATSTGPGTASGCAGAVRAEPARAARSGRRRPVRSCRRSGPPAVPAAWPGSTCRSRTRRRCRASRPRPAPATPRSARAPRPRPPRTGYCLVRPVARSITTSTRPAARGRRPGPCRARAGAAAAGGADVAGLNAAGPERAAHDVLRGQRWATGNLGERRPSVVGRVGQRRDQARGVRVLGRCECRRTGASSTTCPAYMTTTRSTSRATTPRSWVTQIVVMPSSRRSSSTSARICCWMVTSRAVVGSSAISSRGPHRQSAGDHHPLAHAAGELMGVRARGPLRVGNAHPGQQFEHSGAGRGFVDAVRGHRLDHLGAHAHQRVERGHRVLVDHREVAPADRAQVPLAAGRSARGRRTGPRRRRRAAAGQQTHERQHRQ